MHKERSFHFLLRVGFPISLLLFCIANGTCRQIDSDDLGLKAYEKAVWAFEHSSQVHYKHKRSPAAQQVSSLADNKLLSENDCSGFLSWVIDSVSPESYEVIAQLQSQRPYPQAKTFASSFASLNDGQTYKGWQKVQSPLDLKRGDFIAWEKQSQAVSGKKKGNSGHVAMVVDSPGQVFEEKIGANSYRLLSVPVIDSSSVYHFPPEYLPPLAGQSVRDGLGKGQIRLLLNERNEPIGYWEGSFWGEGGKELKEPSLCRRIFFARLTTKS